MLKKIPATGCAIVVSFALAISSLSRGSATEIPGHDLKLQVSEAVPVDVATPGQELQLSDSGDASIARERTATVEISDAGVTELTVIRTP